MSRGRESTRTAGHVDGLLLADHRGVLLDTVVRKDPSFAQLITTSGAVRFGLRENDAISGAL